MSYRSYDAVDFNDLDVETLASDLEEEWTVLACDVAKGWQYAKVFTLDREAIEPEELLVEQEVFRWKHPIETAEVLEMLEALPTQRLEAIVEPSGSYPAGWIESLKAAETIEVRKMRGKKTRDSRENYDNAPSMHDAKAADVIARIHLGGGSQPWWERNIHQRRLKAALKDFDRLKSERKANRGRLEGELADWWPELTEELSLDSTTLLTLAAEFGSPHRLVDNPERAAEVIDRASRGAIGFERMETLLEDAAETVGRRPVDEEIRTLQRLARRQLELKDEIRRQKKRIEDLQDGYDVAENMTGFSGPLVGATVVAEVGDPRDFDAAAAYEKAAGLNLVEDTSGQQGQHVAEDETPPMRISKRGSSRAREQLYLAVQRWIQRCPAARAWYRHKVDQHAGCQGAKTLSLVALMRKLIKLLYHIGRGANYKPSKLFDLERLRNRGYEPDGRTSKAAE